MPVLVIFYAHGCKLPVKSTNQVGRFYHMTFQNAPHWRPGTRLKCQMTMIGEKNCQVCLHQSVAKIAPDFRWRSNSTRSAYKIARCVAGLKKGGDWRRQGKYNIHSTLYTVFESYTILFLVRLPDAFSVTRG